MVALMAASSFIGIRTNREMMANWGQMLTDCRDWIIGTPANPLAYWYTFLPAGLAILVFSVGWSLIGDGVRDLLDPRLKGRGSHSRV